MSCTKYLLGNMPDGTAVDRYILDNGVLRCTIFTCGGALMGLQAPDKQGDPVDIVLGFDNLDSYLQQQTYMGGLIGRYANRISGGQFSLRGRKYIVEKNDGQNHLHGGESGFHKKIWAATEAEDGLTLTLFSPHMEGGYPGNLSVQVQYVLQKNSLIIHYIAFSDADTILNLTNHAYFNLGGHNSGHIGDHRLRLFASEYVPVFDQQCIPMGELMPVANTPMDFQNSRPMGTHIDADFSQLRYGAGYDHAWVVGGPAGALRSAAAVYHPVTGITMEVETTMPGIQFYTGNHLGGGPPGKGGAVYCNRDGFCLETQFLPDSPNQKHFPQPVLRANELWEQSTVLRFSIAS